MLEYDLDLDYDSALHAGGDDGLTVNGRLQLTATLRVRVLASGGQGIHVGVDVPEIRSAHWTLLGEEVPEEHARQAYLAGHRAVVLLDPGGSVEGLRFPPNTPRPFANVVEALVRQAQAPVEPGHNQWTRIVGGAFGHARSHYRVESCTPLTCNLSMERTALDYQGAPLGASGVRFDRVVGEGWLRVTLSQDGHVTGTSTRERLALVQDSREVASAALSARLVLKRRGWETPQSSFLPADGWQQAHELSDRSRENALRLRAAGMTLEQLRADVLHHGNGGKVPRHQRWLWQVTGLLKLHPEFCASLVSLFHDPTLQGPGKALVLDLLANTGHAQAQEALREILGNGDVRSRADYPMLVQRYLLVREPDVASVDFLESRYRGKEAADTRFAAVGALGAALERLAPRDPGTAQQRALALRDDLRAAADPTERRALVTALGNAALPEVLGDILAQTRVDETAVRVAAAGALRKLHEPAATDRLVEMVSLDPDPAVQGAALRALGQHAPSPAQLTHLATALETAPLSQPSFRPLVHLLRDFHRRIPSAHLLPVAEALKRRGVPDNALAHELEELLARLRQGE